RPKRGFAHRQRIDLLEQPAVHRRLAVRAPVRLVQDLYPEASYSLGFVQGAADEREFGSGHRDLVPAAGLLPYCCHLINPHVAVARSTLVPVGSWTTVRALVTSIIPSEPSRGIAASTPSAVRPPGVRAYLLAGRGLERRRRVGCHDRNALIFARCRVD